MFHDIISVRTLHRKKKWKNFFNQVHKYYFQINKDIVHIFYFFITFYFFIQIRKRNNFLLFLFLNLRLAILLEIVCSADWSAFRLFGIQFDMCSSSTSVIFLFLAFYCFNIREANGLATNYCREYFNSRMV